MPKSRGRASARNKCRKEKYRDYYIEPNGCRYVAKEKYIDFYIEPYGCRYAPKEKLFRILEQLFEIEEELSEIETVIKIEDWLLLIIMKSGIFCLFVCLKKDSSFFK